MKHTYTLKDLGQSRQELEVTAIDAQLLEQKEKDALQEFSKELKLKGFRPGQIPEDIVREHVNEGMVKGRAIELCIPDVVNGIVKEEKLRLVERPSVQLESLDPLKIVVSFDVYPTITLGDYSKIQVKVEKKTATDKEVADGIEDLRKRMTDFAEVDRASKKDDRVFVDFEGFDADGKALPNTKSENHPLVLGSNTMIPGFEDEMVGLKAGDEKEFDITFPKDYHAADMANKVVKFKVKVNKVEESQLPEINEEFVEKVLGEKGDEKLLREKMKEEMQSQFDKNAEQEAEDQFYEQFIEKVSVEIPVSMINQEKQAILKELKQRILHQGLSYEKYLETVDKTEEQLLEGFDKQAQDRIKLQLGFAEVAEKEKIDVSDVEVEEYLNKMVEKYPEEKREEMKKPYEPGSEAYHMVTYQIKMQKVREKIVPKG